MNAKTKKPTQAQIIADLVARVEALESRPTRDRGPASERQMTEDDARRILLGDLADSSHKAAASELGLSYGQVYSARNGFTFKIVYKEFRDAEAKKSAKKSAK